MFGALVALETAPTFIPIYVAIFTSIGFDITNCYCWSPPHGDYSDIFDAARHDCASPAIASMKYARGLQLICQRAR
jgi:hypothetical protein